VDGREEVLVDATAQGYRPWAGQREEQAREVSKQSRFSGRRMQRWQPCEKRADLGAPGLGAHLDWAYDALLKPGAPNSVAGTMALCASLACVQRAGQVSMMRARGG